VVLLDVRGLSSVTNFYVVATGNSSPHLKAMASDLDDQLRAAGASRFRKSGTPESGWVVSDYLDVVVHLFAREQRAYYALEQLWNDAKRVP
jgi:ribosome-associated protein